jgi:quercetin dioxygenase-like cupin family protein
VGFRVIHAGEHSWAERPAPAGEAPRRVTDLTGAANLQQSRARIWRIPPGARGRRHKEAVQEEVFVVLAGTLTMLLGEDPLERADLAAHSVVSVEPGTALQMRNEGSDEVVVFAYGSPPDDAAAEYLEDVEL